MTHTAMKPLECVGFLVDELVKTCGYIISEDTLTVLGTPYEVVSERMNLGLLRDISTRHTCEYNIFTGSAFGGTGSSLSAWLVL